MGSGLRIAHVVRSDAFAGVESHITTLATGLAGAGCEVVVIGGEQARMQPVLAAGGVEWVGATSVREAVAELVRRRAFDVVHAHMTAAEIAAVLATRVRRAPVVTTRHFAGRRGSSPAARGVAALLAGRLSAQIAVSHQVAEVIEGPSVVISPGTAVRSDLRDASGREHVVLVAQRMEPEKRTDRALEAWHHSDLAGRGWRLQLAGGGRERARLEAQAQALDVWKSCDFLGPRDDVEALQRRAAIQLAPCAIESLGLSVVEAMATALPVVAAGGGGHLETVGLVPGAALYPPADTRSAGRLLAALAADQDRRTSYGAALLDVHDRSFTVDHQVTGTLRLYETLA